MGASFTDWLGLRNQIGTGKAVGRLVTLTPVIGGSMRRHIVLATGLAHLRKTGHEF